MGKFLRENWLWIVIPVLLALIGLVVLVLVIEGGPGDAAPFIYDV